MRKASAFICVHLWLIFLCFPISAQEFRTIQNGIEYAEMTRGTKEEPVRINLLRLDLSKVRLDVVHAMDAAIGLETTSSIAARHGAMAAINAGFFRLDRSIFAGDAAGVLIIDGKVLSESYADRTALLISNGKVQTEIDFSRFSLQPEIHINKKSYKVGLNRERKIDDLVVYTPEFNRTTLTDNNGIEILVEKDKITKILDGKGSNIIPEDGLVISASGKMREEVLKAAKIKTNTGLVFFTNKPKTIFEDVVNGVPQLIKDGKIEITWEQEKASKAFAETRHPRTAVAKLKDGKFLMVTVDGRQPDYSIGMSLQELAEFLLGLGAVDAMNLDGGGSTTMVLGGKVVNKPSDKEGERRVSDAILVFPRR